MEKIKNSNNSNDCLNYTKNGKININSCLNSRKWKYIEQLGQMRANTPINGKNVCLTLNKTPEKGSKNKVNVSLKKCVDGGTPSQSWSFN